MDTLIIDLRVSERLIEERRARGADRFDEVWEGVYNMAPAPNDEHRDLVGGLTQVLRTVIDDRGLGKTRPGINLTSDPSEWEHDYRVTDMAVFLNESAAVCHGAFWSGPPDFLVEIVSPWDKTRKKLSFYAETGTRELLLVDRDPWRLELYRLQGATLVMVAETAPGEAVIESESLPLQFKLAAGSPRPTIEIRATELQRSWSV